MTVTYAGLSFSNGDVFSACDSHISRRFPVWAAVQFMGGGSLYFEREGHPRREWTQPVFFWTECTSHYAYGPGSTGSWNHHWVCFRGPAFRHHFLPLLESLAPTGVMPVSNGEEVRKVITALIRQLPSSEENIQECSLLLHQLLVTVHAGRPDRPSGDPLIRKIRNKIDADPYAEWDFPRLAAIHGLSYSRFRARFRAQVGAAPGQYLIRRRLRSAITLMSDVSLSIQEIGEGCGYPDPPHFSKVFKTHFGVSPKAYREGLIQIYNDL